MFWLHFYAVAECYFLKKEFERHFPMYLHSLVIPSISTLSHFAIDHYHIFSLSDIPSYNAAGLGHFRLGGRPFNIQVLSGS